MYAAHCCASALATSPVTMLRAILLPLLALAVAARAAARMPLQASHEASGVRGQIALPCVSQFTDMASPGAEPFEVFDWVERALQFQELLFVSSDMARVFVLRRRDLSRSSAWYSTSLPPPAPLHWQLAGRLKSDDEGANLIANPDFEEVAAPGGFPAKWSPVTIFSRATDNVRAPATASLKYSNTIASVYEICSQSIADGAQMSGRRFNLSAWVKTTNVTGLDTGATVAIEYKGPVPSLQSVCVKGTPANCSEYLAGIYPAGVKGTKDWTLVSAIVNVPEVTAVQVDVYLRKGMVGNAWFDSVSLVEIVGWTKMTSFLLSPVYRGRITKGGGCTAISASVSLDFPKAENVTRDSLDLEVTLLSNTTGKVVEILRTVGRDLSSSMTITFAVTPESLDAGNYTVAISLLNVTSGIVLHSNTHGIVRVEDTALSPTAWIDEQKRLIYKGKPFFVIGLYLSWLENDPGDLTSHNKTFDIDLIGKSLFNVIMPYSPPKDQALMDQIDAAGLKIIYSTKDSYWKNRSRESEFVQDTVARFKDSPALLAWYLNDERLVDGSGDLQAHYRWTTHGDPNHPTWSVLGGAPQNLDEYLDTCDAIGTDYYAITGAQSLHQAASTGRLVESIQSQIRKARPVWEVTQALNMKVYHADCATCRTPTFAEERSITWQAVVRGANGIVYYSFFDMMSGCHRTDTCPLDVSNMTQWARMSKIAAELDRWAPVLLSDAGAAPPVAAVNASGLPATSVASRVQWSDDEAHHSVMYLFVANDGSSSGQISFVLGSGLLADTVDAVSEDPLRSVATGAALTSFTDAIAELDVVVYRVRLKTDDAEAAALDPTSLMSSQLERLMPFVDNGFLATHPIVGSEGGVQGAYTGNQVFHVGGLQRRKQKHQRVGH